MNSPDRPILVGLDADARSDASLAAALELGRRFRLSVRALHAVPLAPILWTGADSLPATPVVGPEVLQALHARISARIAPRLAAAAGVPFELHVKLGHPARLLIEEAHAIDAHLICLGPHRKRGVVDFGSTARAVLARAPGGVWLQVDEPRPIRTVLCAVDLSQPSLAALAAARDVCLAFEARLAVLFVFQPPDPTMMAVDEAALPPLWDLESLRASARREFERALSGFDWCDVPHDLQFAEGDPAAEILGRQEAADLLVIGTHGRTGLSALLLGSVAYSVLRSAHRPVLALRHPEERVLPA